MAHTGLRGTFYALKHICSSLFLLCLGFLLCTLFQITLNLHFDRLEESTEFLLLFVIVLFASGLLWLVLRSLYNARAKAPFQISQTGFSGTTRKGRDYFGAGISTGEGQVELMFRLLDCPRALFFEKKLTADNAFNLSPNFAIGFVHVLEKDNK